MHCNLVAAVGLADILFNFAWIKNDNRGAKGSKDEVCIVPSHSGESNSTKLSKYSRLDLKSTLSPLMHEVTK